jgi:hypothetical protein
MYLVEHEAERRGIIGTAEHLALRRAYTSAARARASSRTRTEDVARPRGSLHVE